MLQLNMVVEEVWYDIIHVRGWAMKGYGACLMRRNTKRANAQVNQSFIHGTTIICGTIEYGIE